MHSHLDDGQLGADVLRVPMLASSAIAVVDSARASLREEKEAQARAKAAAQEKRQR